SVTPRSHRQHTRQRPSLSISEGLPGTGNCGTSFKVPFLNDASRRRYMRSINPEQEVDHAARR
ncbi:MAG TPA: hypothetical protein VGP12_01485, partial [Nitrosospira sp.]|nr:hypothetical protein [Nitrosospira sp.]